MPNIPEIVFAELVKSRVKQWAHKSKHAEIENAWNNLGRAQISGKSPKDWVIDFAVGAVDAVTGGAFSEQTSKVQEKVDLAAKNVYRSLFGVDPDYWQ